MTSKKAKPKKKVVAKKKAVKKAAAKKAPPKKAVKKAAAKPKQVAAKKPTVKKAAAKKPAVKKALSRKPVAKKAPVKAAGTGGVKTFAAEAEVTPLASVATLNFSDLPDGSRVRLLVEVEGSGVVFAAKLFRNGEEVHTWSSSEVRAGDVDFVVRSPHIYILQLRIRFTNGPATVRIRLLITNTSGKIVVDEVRTVSGQSPDTAALNIGLAT